MLKSVAVRDYMTSAMITLAPEIHVVKAAQTMMEYRLTGAPVLDENNRLVGYLSEKDCLHTVLSAIYHGEIGDRVMDRMTKEVKTCHPDDSIAVVAERFLQDNCRMYPVVEKSKLVGMISRQSILKALQYVGIG
ncbi:CBS domain-containing protein [Kangiella sp. TOML190]|uniref:CBS domain-containing protein n=1 Tax=Kangiella sp. TOML190 TaxID=2931351 RepID=UPI00203B07DB|nr:CBS domain-containing protein [Kangiella sp. TOML190]